ncbi:MAG: FKBP-type peptidyl-prolyl cis-trans isomerase [Pseudomonadota bacterium]|nr:MAG: peptidylprolyl isomerase [Pseudomonadota bacterium]
MLAQRTVLVIALGVALAACQKKTEEPAAAETAAPATAPSEAAPQTEATQAAPAAAPAPTGIPAPPDVAAPPKDAQKTASGLVTRVLTPGTGNKHPTDSDQVKVHYTGWTKDGKQFDSSVERGQPAVFGVSQVIPGWTEALKLMVAGEKRRIWIPAKLAYGESPRMGAPAGDLTFDVELIEILEPPKAPEDVKAPPASAKRTPSGLAYRVLTPGTGKRHPKATDRVTVHYSGWTTDGKLFDSSVQRGQPTTFALNQVIPGWTEGVQLMVEGEKTRFWIPAKLAYGEKPARPGAPAGMLVFDIELLQIR